MSNSLVSISLLLDEPSPNGGPSLSSLLPEESLPYRQLPFSKNQEKRSPNLVMMPEVFHFRLIGHSKIEFMAINTLYRMVEMVRYNFSDGVQVPAKEILRHPYHIYVNDEFLPQPKYESLHYGESILTPWPLIQTDSGPMVKPTEEIMQSLLNRLVTAHRQKRLEIFLQTHAQSTKSLKLTSIFMEPTDDLDWRIEFTEQKSFSSSFKIISHRNRPLFFFDSYALEPENGVLIVHAWKSEFSLIQERLSQHCDSSPLVFKDGNTTFELDSESKTKQLIQFLRQRKVPLKISGESTALSPSQSVTEIHFTNEGHFKIRHEARISGQKNILRQGWSPRTTYYLMSLSQGLPFALNKQAKEMASEDSFKRDWDLNLLKHLGIFQYIFFETLYVLFEKTLSDGTPASNDTVLNLISEKIKLLLTANSEISINDSASLSMLVSHDVLTFFDQWIQQVANEAEMPEAFYSESGEVIMGGVSYREFRLIFELFKRLSLVTGGSIFKKVRTPLLGRISSGVLDNESSISQSQCYFSEAGLSSALEIVQNLIPLGFKIFLNEQPLHELRENDLVMDFSIYTRLDQEKINWFELSPKFFLMGQEVGPESILRLGTGGIIEYENKFYLVPQKQMPSLRLLEDFWQKLQTGKKETSKSKPSSHLKLPQSQTLYLLALRKAGIPFKGDPGWNSLCEFFDNLGLETRPIVTPTTMQVQLKDYQKVGVQWLHDLYQLRLGALLADDMGLGKTLQTLTFLESLRIQNEMGNVLVVVPTSLVFNWVNEIEKFTPLIPTAVFTAEKKDSILNGLEPKGVSKVVIITYGLLTEHSELIALQKWNIVIYDEAQNIKNIGAKRTTAARSVKSRFKIALTGTPVENHYGDLYSIIDTLVPSSLGPLDNFRRQFVDSPVVDYELIRNLKMRTRPIILRRSKKEILDQLPEKRESVVRITFEEQQKEIYRNIALSFNRRIHETMAFQGKADIKLQMFTALLRLRQVCSDPTGLPDVTYDKTPPKLETLVESLKEIQETGESALVFTQFLQTLNHTENLLKSAGLTVFILHGTQSAGQRKQILSQFQSHEGGAILLMTLKTGGVGLNLTKASYVFHIEPWWNPAVENQATDRAHRLGQTKAVNVIKYIMHESLEEKIELLKERKETRFQALFSDSEEPTEQNSAPKSLSKEDFDILIEL